MRILVPFLLTLSGAALLFLPGRRLASSPPYRQHRFALLLLSAAFAVPALLFAAYYTHVFDDAAWFYAFRAFPLTEYAAAGIGLAAGLAYETVRQSRPLQTMPVARKLLAVSSVFLPFLALFLPYVKPLVIPLNVPFGERWRDGVCLQSVPSTCGPSSAATLLHSRGIRATEAELARECFTSATGTENWYLVRALRRRGLNVRYVTGPPEPESLLYPAIAGTQLGPGGSGHYIVVLGREGDRYVIGDPLTGRHRFRRKDLKRLYHFTGFYIALDGRRSPA
jgi:hypothetical protein